MTTNDVEINHRGFDIYKFVDVYGEACSLQKSSAGNEPCIWLGCSDIKPKYCVPREGWKEFPLPEQVMVHGRMHLTQEMVRELLPMLQKFAETGDIADHDQETN